ncbi:ABC transporter ATP-binding protein [Candidatus Dependentiae bacterium]|nr:ABC transporter ATP-binding protein [Candidatus Dependentiae bacterium]MCC7414922.1 ABC transporter ATP-binding protein [Campylobacterota bacterium]
MTLAVISATKITKQFTQGQASLLVLDHVDCTLIQGQTYAVTGVSGSGKSTLLHTLAGLDEPTTGTIFFNDRNMAKLTATQRHTLLNRSFGLVFQSSYLMKELTVLENVMMPGLIAGAPYEPCRAQAAEILSVVGLSEKASSHPLTLSGGQQQRVAIARALFNKPAFLFADEPTGNLDEKTGHDVVSFLLECQQQWNMGLVVSTHDIQVANRMQTTFVLHNGALTTKS